MIGRLRFRNNSRGLLIVLSLWRGQRIWCYGCLLALRGFCANHSGELFLDLARPLGGGSCYGKCLFHLILDVSVGCYLGIG